MRVSRVAEDPEEAELLGLRPPEAEEARRVAVWLAETPLSDDLRRKLAACVLIPTPAGIHGHFFSPNVPSRVYMTASELFQRANCEGLLE